MDLVVGFDDPERRLLVGSHQRGVADDVGEHDGCEASSRSRLCRGSDRLVEVVTLAPLSVVILVGRQDVLVKFEIGS